MVDLPRNQPITVKNPGLTAEQAREILRKRHEAIESLVGFAKYVDIPGVPMDEAESTYQVVETEVAAHHELTYQALDDMVQGRLCYDPDTLERVDSAWVGKTCKRVMIMEPPGSAKSTCASVVFPTWVMGKWPQTEIILTGYGDVIAKRHGKRSRQLVKSSSYGAVFDTGLDPAMKAADDWTMTNASSYKAAGILSGITGFRCDGLIWDDLMKGRKEADSETIRNDTWNAYIDDARSRKKPSAWEVGIGTRWHEDDPMGRILPEGYNGENGFMQCRDGNIWFVICIPAQAERADDPLGREIGQYLWDEWFGEDYWQDKKLNARSWASLYQQRPAPDEGLYFKKEWFKRYDALPPDEELNKYISFDPAVTAAEESADADDTAIHVWGVDQYGRVHLIDEWVRQCTMDVWIAQLMALIQIHRPMEVISESGVIRRAAEPFIKRAMVNTGSFAKFEYVTRHADKSAMARSAQAMYSAGMIYHPNNSVGNEMEDELLRFPTAKSDHRVDSVANLCLRLEHIWESNAPKVEPPKSNILNGGEMKVSQFMPARFSKKRKDRWHQKKF